MEMITDYVPGAYMTHDMLHMRGGHQTSWLIDGIAIPNTKIASNVGPQIDPKDIDSLETQRGSYASDVGDRTYGVFNVLPRNGFERNRDGELLISAGNLYTGETQLSLGDHCAATAWYASLTGSRSNYGLATPVAQIHHDATNSAERLCLAHPQPDAQRSAPPRTRNTARITSRFPTIPTPTTGSRTHLPAILLAPTACATPKPSATASSSPTGCTPSRPKRSFSVAPFYHFNQADYDSLPTDNPVATTWHQSSNYAGGQADGHARCRPEQLLRRPLLLLSGGERSVRRHRQRRPSAPSQPEHPRNASAALVEFYLSDHLRLGRYVTLLGGERFSIYHARL